jgi:hypothetical protein
VAVLEFSGTGKGNRCPNRRASPGIAAHTGPRQPPPTTADTALASENFRRRRFALHARGRWFEPSRAHSPKPASGAGFLLQTVGLPPTAAAPGCRLLPARCPFRRAVATCEQPESDPPSGLGSPTITEPKRLTGLVDGDPVAFRDAGSRHPSSNPLCSNFRVEAFSETVRTFASSNPSGAVASISIVTFSVTPGVAPSGPKPRRRGS